MDLYSNIVLSEGASMFLRGVFFSSKKRARFLLKIHNRVGPWILVVVPPGYLPVLFFAIIYK